MRAALLTAGERVEVTCAHRRIGRILEEGAANLWTSPDGSAPDVRVRVEHTSEPFDTAGWEVLTRDAWRLPGRVVVRDACSSGLDVLVTATGTTLDVAARWRPPLKARAAASVLRARSQLLIRAVLLQYPALWWAQQRGRVPLHASVCTVGSPVGPAVLIAGPGGVGKSTLVNAELARGARSTTDNLCVSDGRTAWGVLEPRRVPADDPSTTGGRRMPHGRREAAWPSRVDLLAPDLVVVLRRGSAPAATASPCPSEQAVKALVAGTYMAGELRRYWAFAATLALGTGLGDIQPAVEQVARTFADKLPTLEVVLGDRPGTPLAGLIPDRADAGVKP